MATQISVSVNLQPGELTRLDHMCRFLDADRSEVLRRALTCMSAAGDVMFGHCDLGDFQGHNPHVVVAVRESATPFTDVIAGR